jgi:regulator of sigma E protease
MPPIIIQIGLFLLSLSILIILHEWGHYITARWFKVRVIKFYLFFDFLFPMPDVLKGAIFKKKIGETEYGIGWFPLGGYVQMAGIMDESMDKEALKEPPKPDEFRSKPAWQRLIILLGGVTVNILLAFVIYGGVLWHWGEKQLSVDKLPYGLYAGEAAQSIGIQTGDVIKYVGDKEVKLAGEELLMMLLDKAEEVTVLRNGELVKVENIPGSFYGDLVKGKLGGFVSPAQTTVVDTLIPGGGFSAAGGQKGDRIVSIDSAKVEYFQELAPQLLCKRNTSVVIGVERGSDTVLLHVPVSETDKIGIGPKDEFVRDTIRYSFPQAMVGGVKKSMEKLDMYIDQFGLMFDKDIKGYKQVGGFGAIGGLFPNTVDWEAFWNLTAFLSIMLAFLNLLPIPALDGGHALFTVYEMIFRRPPNEKFMEYAQMTGMVLLLALVVLANGNDLIKHFFPPAGPC